MQHLISMNDTENLYFIVISNYSVLILSLLTLSTVLSRGDVMVLITWHELKIVLAISASHLDTKHDSFVNNFLLSQSHHVDQVLVSARRPDTL